MTGFAAANIGFAVACLFAMYLIVRVEYLVFGAPVGPKLRTPIGYLLALLVLVMIFAVPLLVGVGGPRLIAARMGETSNEFSLLAQIIGAVSLMIAAAAAWRLVAVLTGLGAIAAGALYFYPDLLPALTGG